MSVKPLIAKPDCKNFPLNKLLEWHDGTEKIMPLVAKQQFSHQYFWYLKRAIW
jgi:hypothetical protein